MTKQISKIGELFAEEKAILIILDACRYDMFCEIVATADKVLSLGSCTCEWALKTM